jgi:hypothetical protein
MASREADGRGICCSCCYLYWPSVCLCVYRFWHIMLTCVSSVPSGHCPVAGKDQCSPILGDAEGPRKTRCHLRCVIRCESHKSPWSQQNCFAKSDKLAEDRGDDFPKLSHPPHVESLHRYVTLQNTEPRLKCLTLTDSARLHAAIHVFCAHLCVFQT